MYVKIHLLLLFGTNLFCNKSGMTIHWKFLPLLRNFSDIRGFSWGSACLAHLYRALCRTSQRLPFLAPVRSHPSFLLACRDLFYFNWMFWRSQFHGYQKWTISHTSCLLDDIPADGSFWNVFAVFPNDILQHRLMWSAIVPLISFEGIEWHASDRVMRQFGLAQEVPREATRLAESHNVVLTGPKNKDWRVEHSGYIMRWTNRLSFVLVGDPALHYQASDRYMQWYTEAYGAHLRLTGYVSQPQSQPQPQPQP
ncbi:hypothetical protein AHAS_Ahas11G0218400 [Arachis hypogaea]